MKCSLLSLSTLIDGELAPDRVAEVDAHMVGCERCRAGASTLREEKARVARLARVQVDEASAQVMLEQVGIVVDRTASWPHATAPPPPPSNQLPWQSGTSSAALPWTPRRPSPGGAPTAEASPPATSPENQPDLPFGGGEIVPRPWEAAAVTADPDASAEVELMGTHHGRGFDTPDPSLKEADGWPDTTASAESWEADLPPPIEPDLGDAGDSEPWDSPHIPAAPPQPPAVPPPPLLPSLEAPVPIRAPTAFGPAGLLSRVRNALAVRRALARDPDGIEDSAQIVTGIPPRRGIGRGSPAAPPSPEVAATAATAAERLAAEDAPRSAIELHGTRGVGLPSRATRDARVSAGTDIHEREPDQRPAGWSSPPQAPPARGALPAPVDPEAWNAFAASSFPAGDRVVEKEPAASPRPLGRHSRAVARENVDVVTRVRRVLVAAALALRARTATATAGARTRIGSASSAGPDSRLLAGIAGIGLIFVVALLIGHASSPARTATSTHLSPTSRTAPHAQPQSSAPAQTSAPSTTSAAAPAVVQTYGSGATGFQVTQLIYGKHATFVRVVFDMGAVGAPRTGTPRVTVAFSDPKTVLVTLNGTAPAGSVGAVPAGSIISSITLVSGDANRTEYRIVLTRAATDVAFFLSAPTRFVLDLH